MTESNQVPEAPLARSVEEFGTQRFSNRELSRLDFGSRLLDLAEDSSQKLLERVKFLAIFSDLLDEFFQVRVANLEDQAEANVRRRSVDGLTPAEQLPQIRNRVLELTARVDEVFLHQLIPALKDAGIRLSKWSELDTVDQAFLANFFDDLIFPVLTPLAVDPGHPFPIISNLSLNLAIVVRDGASGEERVARVKVPANLPRFVVMPDGERFVGLEDIISANLGQLFSGMEIRAYIAFRVTRNADLALAEEEADDLLVALEQELARRRFGDAVRLEVTADSSNETRAMLASELELSQDNVYISSAPLGLTGLWALYGLDRPELKGEAWKPITPYQLKNPDGSAADIFEVLRQGDLLVHHPYDSFSASVEQFIAQAAQDPDVLGIKQTLYRTSGNSPIVASLIDAAAAGKQVAALVELKARFDEEANIGWAKALEDAGVHVVYGIVGFKTHSKTALVLRREGQRIRRYCHIGTGNYNSRTARNYEDLGLLTADEEISQDVGELFNYLTGFSRLGDFKKLLVSPVTMRSGIIEEIEMQAALGPKGRIVIKCNGLTDPASIDALYRASMAGVPIDLAIRGMCCLRPGVPGLSETVTVRSIVGEFLEHSRVFVFGRPDGDEPVRVFIGSADLMERNLDRRIEAATPISDPSLIAKVLHIVDLVMHDDTNTWLLGPDQRWRRFVGSSEHSLHQKLRLEALETLRKSENR